MQLAEIYPQVQAAGAELWAISPQEQAKNQALRERRDLPFPILADADQTVIRAWGIFNAGDPKGRAIPYPATYVVKQDGRIGWFHLGLTTRDRPTAGKLLAAVKAVTEDSYS